MVGPVLYTFGTPEQIERHLIPLREGHVLWCQGFSEPGAGSDLAALGTRAVRDGADYIVNGQKIWTTNAHWRSEEHTSELQSIMRISYHVFCLKKKNTPK